MQRQKLFLVSILPAAAVLFLNSAILRYSMISWREPREVCVHAAIVAVFCYFVGRRLGVLPALVGALVFGLFPTHASVWALGSTGWVQVALYICILCLSIALSFGFERFYTFLKTQEAMVRYLFIVGVAIVILGMVLMGIMNNGVWKSESSLWKWRSLHQPSAATYNAQARLLAKDVSNTQEVISTYLQSLKVEPSNQEALFSLGFLYQDLARPQDVIEAYNQLLKFYPEDSSIYVRIIEGYGRAIQQHPEESIYQEKREGVLTAYEQLTKRKKYTSNDYFNLGFLYEQVGGFEEAMRFYRKALELDPKHEPSLSNLANRYQLAGENKTALVLYERLIRLYPKSATAYLNMGIIYNSMGDANKARYLYQKVINIDADNADAYFNLAYLKETAGEIREALNDYEKAIESNPKHAEAYYNMGNAYATLGQYPEAIASYLKTVDIDPKHQNAYVNLSILSFKSKDFQGAIRFLELAKNLGYNPPAEYLKTLEPYRGKK